MDFHVLTLFPEMIDQGLGTSITGRALRQKRITLESVNIRDFSDDKHRRVDDYTYGGGAGMLMRTQPVYDAWKQVRDAIPEEHRHVRTIYVTPQGYPFNQRMAEDFSRADDLIFICGHYEGIDERVLEETVTDYVSIGDYVLTGGELAAMVMIDAIARLVPGVLHNEESAETESFHGNLLEYPQYSRPEEWHGKTVPEVLLSGNQKQIDAWRLEQSLKRTRERRPDLYLAYRKLQDTRSILMKSKLLNAPMISLIDRGLGEVLMLSGNSAAMRSLASGNLFLYDPDHSAYIREQFDKMAGDYAEKLHGNQNITCMICEPSAEAEYVPWVLTRKEKLPVTGLYRPDGKPTAAGVTICKAQENAAAGELVLQAFVGTRDAGRICRDRDGRIHSLYVKEEFRRRHIGMALETCLCNDMLENGFLPYMLLKPDDRIMTDLQQKLGLYPGKGRITLRKADSDKI